MSKIELRLSNVDPPNPEPKRTIYRDIVNLPDPVKLGLTIRYFNHDDVGLYFQITGSAPGYTFNTVNLGLLASGADAYANLDEFASRAKPSPSDLPNGEKDENITLILKAYTDSAYTNLKWTFERVVTVHWINSADPAWTVDVLNNFDDGTTQGWAAARETDIGIAYTEVRTDYVLSPPYSCGFHGQTEGTTAIRFRSRFYKSFTTPNKDKVFAILNLRYQIIPEPDGWGYGKNLRIQNGDTILVYLGKPYDTVLQDYFPRNKWIRIVVPLPKNTTVEVRVVVESISKNVGYYPNHHIINFDDFKIISK